MNIAIPSSSLINENDEKIKAYKVWQIARYCAIFRVEKIYIYHDPRKDDSGYIKDILEYLETPQYLRKSLFPIKKSLSYAGALPPLAIPSHKPKHLKIGELRDGVVRKVGPDGTLWVDVGLPALALMKGDKPKGARVTVRVCSKTPLVVEEAEPREYWGYRVEKVKLGRILDNSVILSRRGKPISESLEEINQNSTLLFGNPEEGVHEIARRLKIKLDGIPSINSIPNQGTETVRLEEAIIATLAIINSLKG
ncbi:hypothetical protein Asulf_00129 [Archaeoglobus sulfaticallidus PM70-1]|uniref:RNA-binding protein n=1 Tax=Archaeoglobus sulfaticallidus PM70-1 TaxID=387631 RepID=N0BJ24_9EURY|nr:putative RNA uridine N3 methyltransferase [Archaeoglobus sulfaticallidus]AGK60165.1 hypothetical protein Asulf_00129 [Archaeoglobus sulfaticallidus PM70-1]